jgi:HD-GYP domain-containing protein (c-di-GMP phosphodiesterase class II)
VLKKQAEEVVTAPATPAPVATQPAPQPAETKQAAPQSRSKSAEKVPVNQGTIKKLVTPAPAADAELETGTDEGTTATRRTRRTASRTTARRRTASNGQTSNRPRQRSGSGPVTGSRDAQRTQEPQTEAGGAAATSAKRAAARARAERRRSAAIPAAAEPAEDERSSLGSITHAADAVVEVIPGTVVLALAGLSGLVLLLVARSWAMERRRTAALACSYGVTVEALATAIEAKDHTTGGHIERVRSLGLLLAGEIVPREARDPQMAYGFLLHDIGKLAVPDAILLKPSRLTALEYEQVKRHAEAGRPSSTAAARRCCAAPARSRSPTTSGGAGAGTRAGWPATRCR